MSDTTTLEPTFPWRVAVAGENLARFHPYILLSAAYVLASWLTRPLLQGDTVDYADSIVSHAQGGNYNFWEFGHLLWRPLGSLSARVLSFFLASAPGPEPRIQAILALTFLSWVAGLASALLLFALLRCYCAHRWIPVAVAVAFEFSATELNYSRAGTAYIPGLSLLLLGMYLVARAAARPSNNGGLQGSAGLALAGSVAIWFPYVLAVPAAVLLSFSAEASSRNRLRTALGTFFFFGLGILTAYGAVLLHLRLLSPGEMLSWMAASSHGTAIRGLFRTIFGGPRSFLDMGSAGRIVKRYLLHDPFHPVSTGDLVRLWPELLKFTLFYLTLLSLAVNLGSSSCGRKILAVTAVAALPVLAFAVYWSGGDLERYLPFYPAFFLALCLSLADPKAAPWEKAAGWAFIFSLVLANPVSLRAAIATQSQAKIEDRAGQLFPRMKRGSLVVVSHNLDDLMEFSRNYPLSPWNRQGGLDPYPLITAGTIDVPRWPELFAARAFSAWRDGGDVWVSSRVLQPEPRTDWNWVEGDEPRVSWRDLHRLFSGLEYGETVGGDDGFLLLLPSNGNKNVLNSISSNSSSATPGHN